MSQLFYLSSKNNKIRKSIFNLAMKDSFQFKVTQKTGIAGDQLLQK